MTNAIATFEKISFAQFYNDYKKLFENRTGKTLPEENEEYIRDIWKNIKLPQRATEFSAGYDFYLPTDTWFSSETDTQILTGIRCNIQDGYFLMLVPRSGLGFKYGFNLKNQTGIVDSDYFYADNEGHIQAKVKVDSPFRLEAGDRFMQGIFVPFGITTDDQAIGSRHGGFGSTGTK